MSDEARRDYYTEALDQFRPGPSPFHLQTNPIRSELGTNPWARL